MESNILLLLELMDRLSSLLADSIFDALPLNLETNAHKLRVQVVNHGLDLGQLLSDLIIVSVPSLFEYLRVLSKLFLSCLLVLRKLSSLLAG